MVEPDRRIRRTRRSLHEALIALILERGYEKITVQDILDRADIGRSTFYAHFRDKDALLLTSFEGLRTDLRRDLDGLVQGPTVLFEHAYRHRSVYRALCGRHGAGTVVFRHLHDVIGGLLREQLAATPGSGLPPELVSEFYTSALLGLLTWWIDHDFPYGPAELARVYARLGAAGLRVALDADPARIG